MRYLKPDDGLAAGTLFAAYRDRLDCPAPGLFFNNAGTYELAYMMNGEHVMGVAMRKRGALHIGVLPEWRKRWATRSLVRRIVEWAAETGKVWTRVAQGNEAGEKLVRQVGFELNGERFELNRMRQAFATGECDVVSDFFGGAANAVGDALGGAAGAVGDAVGGVFDTIKDNGLGAAVGGALAVVFAPVTGGASLALWAALGASAGTLLTGGSIGDAMKNGALAYVGGELFGGAGAGAESAGTAGLDASTGQFAGEAATSGAAGASGAGSIAGVSTDPQQFLLASANPNPGTMTDVSPGLIGSQMQAPVASDLPVSAAPGAFDTYGSTVSPGASATIFDGAGAGANRGLIGSAMDFAKANPMLSAAALQVGGGMLAGAGNQANQRQMLDKKISADRDLERQRQQQAIELEEWKRRFAQSGSYFDALIPFKRSANPGLTRPGGAPVFSPNGGLIAGQMAG